MMRGLRYHQFNYERTNYNYALNYERTNYNYADGCNPVNSATVRLQGEF
ncbi:hypothetical protein LTSEMON_2832 [Salmonella enterica subsp. enterica serovar Montevideo str. S5-403]|uniref:Porin n=1 Tax=Salmonella enterica subsp. enterica serovar Montevideo str. S5-403 TaxID=913242 RepID=G5Q462_SALMO|nr:hypothetical protein LTSEMON_2832 [Salmonella enterica subsp. enterica serovar Montevideo str. S5-403]